jgi:hypothetical protein
MLDVWRVKKTKEIVYPMGKQDNNYTLCLFRHANKTLKGNYGDVRAVRTDNLMKDREDG